MPLKDVVDTLFGTGDKKQTTDQETTRDTREARVGLKIGREETIGEETGTSITNTYDERNISDTLRRLSQGELDRLSRVANTLEGRIGGIDTRVDSFVDDLVSTQRARSIQDFERGELSEILAGAQSIGSLDNTTAQLLLGRGKAGLITDLNAQEAETRFLGESFKQQELGLLLDNLLGAVNVAKGGVETRNATITDRGSSTTDYRRKTASSTLSQAIDSLLGEQRTRGISTGTAKVNHEGLLDRIF